MLLLEMLGIFRFQQELSKAKSNIIPFKGKNKSKSLFKKVIQVASCQLFIHTYIHT